jgi:uncharacterized protein YkwD
MRFAPLSCTLACALVTAACGGSGGAPDHGAGEPAELAGITAAHNQVRASVGVGPLTWDPALAATASAWVAQCIDGDRNGLVDHNPGRSSGSPTYVGENIYGSTGNATGQAAVTAWAAEQAAYDYATNTCSAVCGHYTQVVWAASTRVGCAKHDCAGLTYRSTIVCDYAPGGNTGGRPY